jgi:hypothetical protein
MKSRKSNLLIIDSCGSEVLDKVLATVNYEIEGDGAILLHTDDLTGQVPELKSYLETFGCRYEGLILLRK